MILPISDDDRSLSKPAYVTHALLWINILVFVYQVTHPAFTYGWSMVPAEITSGTDLVRPLWFVANGERVEIPHAPGPSPVYLTLLTSMFMHGGLVHIGANMLYLWIFGDNVEHRFGHLPFLGFYLASGLAGAVCQIAIDPDSVIPNLGASGAISGIMGAYLVLFPWNRVMAVIFVFIVSIPAYVLIGLWALFQLAGGWDTIVQTQQTGGVAYAAHLGGFATGLVVALYQRRRLREEPDSIFYEHYQRDPLARRLW